jgi:hypothetical protein
MNPDQMSKAELETLVGQKLTSVELHGSHGAEYILRFESGKALYITHSDYTKDLYFNWLEGTL